MPPPPWLPPSRPCKAGVAPPPPCGLGSLGSAGGRQALLRHRRASGGGLLVLGRRPFAQPNFYIKIIPATITIEDSGIGMTKNELINNLYDDVVVQTS